MTHDLLAAIDLGSNSFRLQIGRVNGSQIYEVEALKETVRLAGGLDENKNLTEGCQQNALETLQRFGKRLSSFDSHCVRVVGTHTFRAAKNSAAFIERAQQALGFPIEVIAGIEEARLIYIGVTHSLPNAKGNRLVVDIGGGSTECIIGKGTRPIKMESLYMGCVSYSKRFFADGQIDEERLTRAELAALTKLDTISANFQNTDWEIAIASSGTAQAIEEILTANGLSHNGITKEGLETLRKVLLQAGNVETLSLEGLTPDRKPILASGFVIMSAIVKALNIHHMEVSDRALRHGVLYDLLERVKLHDKREATANALMRSYRVDRIQAEKVEALALSIYDQLAKSCDRHANERQLLMWAARLHEIGLDIAHSGYHKHSAYILQNADLPGFSKMDQSLLALIVNAHRGSLCKVKEALVKEPELHLIFSLRLAALLCRGRNVHELPSPKIDYKHNEFDLFIETDWLKQHPLTETPLQEDLSQWRSEGVEVALKKI